MKEARVNEKRTVGEQLEAIGVESQKRTHQQRQAAREYLSGRLQGGRTGTESVIFTSERANWGLYKSGGL